MSTYRALLAATVVAFFLTGPAHAQTSAPEDRASPGDPPARADRVDDDEFDLGWIGLIGLLGLAGLTGRRRGDYMPRGTNVKTDRV